MAPLVSLLLLLLLLSAGGVAGLLGGRSHVARRLTTTASAAPTTTDGNVVLLDHLNINHEKGRHDLVVAFYLDTLGLALDPRKRGNLADGKDTLWVNMGITQLHLPEADKAQVFDGIITLSCTGDVESFAALVKRLERPPAVLTETYFSWCKLSEMTVAVRDPWGTCFVIVHDPSKRDTRGSQPDAEKALLPCTLSDLTLTLPVGKTGHHLRKIANFYQLVFGAPSLAGAKGTSEDRISICVSPQQTLSFQCADTASFRINGVLVDVSKKLQEGCTRPPPVPDSHEEVQREHDGEGKIIANSGPHVSMYVQDFAGIYTRAEKLGCLFTNTRFERQAYSLAEAQEQSMFRTLDVVDPDGGAGGDSDVILRLEHEVRSVLGKDGKTLYKSCPFDALPTNFRP